MYFRSLLLFLSFSSAQTVQITVDRNVIEEGSYFTLAIEVLDSDNFAKVDMRQLGDDFEIISGPSEQTNIQWINGGMKSSKILSWTIAPLKTGNVKIPSISGLVGDKIFRGKPISIKVKKAINSTDNSVFIIAEINNNQVFLGEQITLKYKLYKSPNVDIASIDQFKIPEFPGFWVEDIFTPQKLQYQAQNEIYQGVAYQVANLGQRALFPIPSDNYLIPSVKVKVQLKTKKRQRRKDPFFDPFFDSFFTATKALTIKSKEKNILIKPFPEPRPSGFTGAVGDFTIKSSTDRDTTKVNEGFTFTVSLRGTGNLGLFTLPIIKFPDEFEVFPPIEKFEKENFRDELTGSQSWEYILIPRNTGILKIPKIQLSFFNPKINSWQETKTNSIKVVISPGDKNVSLSSGFTKREVELIGQDIRFIHTGPTAFTIIGEGNQRVAIILYFCSIFIFCSPSIISRFTGYRLNTEEGRKIRRALRTGLKELDRGRDNPLETSSSVFYKFLKTKLSLRSHNLDPSFVKNLLESKIDSNFLNEIISLLTVCDAGRFAPNEIELEDTLIDDMSTIIKKLDKELE